MSGTPASARDTRQAFFAVSAYSRNLSSVEAGRAAFGLQLDAGEGRAGRRRAEMHLGDRVDALGHMAGLAEDGGERHGEAAGMRGRDQLFRIGARPILEARREGIGAFEDAAAEPQPAGAFLQ